MRPLSLFSAMFYIYASCVSAQAASAAPLRRAEVIQMPAGFMHFDHFGVDAKGGRLFATFEDQNSVEVFDLKSGKQTRSITGFKVPHNVLFLPERNELVVTDGGGTFNILRGDTLQTLHTVKLARNADFVAYDPRTQLFYVTNGGHAADMSFAFVSIIDTTGKHLGDIRIEGAHIEFLTAEKAGSRLFLNVADKHQVAVIDRANRAVVALWPLPEAEENLPLTVDESHSRLFTVSRKPAEFFVLDAHSGKVITSLPCVGDSDDMAYDAKTQRIYVSGGAGFVSVFQQQDADHYTALANITTGPGGNTSVFVPELNRLYVGVRRGKTGPELQVFDVVP